MNESFSVPDEKLRQESVKNLQQVQKTRPFWFRN